MKNQEMVKDGMRENKIEDIKMVVVHMKTWRAKRGRMSQ